MGGTASLTALAMLAFAANSVLARLALGTGEAEALGYTGLRLVSGALVLAVLVGNGQWRRPEGSNAGAAALLGYALTFSLAYLMLDTGTGALILFASVQAGMIVWAVHRGERPGAMEWLGFGLALAAFGALVAPGVTAPHPPGLLLMVGAGLCWAAYSLIGRGSAAPLKDTAGNFLRCVPLGLLLLAAGLWREMPSAFGAGLAVASGAVASGLGYALWYAVLPRLARASAAFVQLTVPAIAAAGGVLLLGEPLTARLVLASAGILGGVALALAAAERRRRG